MIFHHQMKKIAIVLYCMFQLACNDVAVSPVEYMKLIDDSSSGFIKTIAQGPVVFEVKYKPIEYVALQRIGQPRIKEEDFNEILSEYRGLQYFTFVVRSIDGSTNPLHSTAIKGLTYQEIYSYLDVNFNKDICLIEDNDTLLCKLHHVERSNDLVPEIRIVIAFEDQVEGNKESALTFLYNDLLYGTGVNEFKFSKAIIDELPRVKTL